MSNKLKSSLLAKYLSAECTASERRVVEKWLEADINNETSLNSFKSIWAIEESNLETSNTKAIWSKIAERISEDESLNNSVFEGLSKSNLTKSSPPFIIKLIQYPALRYAAVFLIILLIPLLYYLNTQQNNINTIETWKTIAVENGGLTTLKLSDGSKLILDAGSRLQYPEKFSNESREIKIEGEAYLEVEHDSQKPFRVRTANALIEVLGTKFNVRSWKESNRVEVAVVNGKVALEISDDVEKRIILEKGFAGSLSANGELTKPKRVEIDSYLSWINGEISFDDVPFFEVLSQVERWYNIRFSLQDSTFINDRLTVSIHKNSLSNVLGVLTALTNTRYEKSDNIITLRTAREK
jgi:ferric-dicitrate binding protein FerR (iron transport regulator)